MAANDSQVAPTCTPTPRPAGARAPPHPWRRLRGRVRARKRPPSALTLALALALRSYAAAGLFDDVTCAPLLSYGNVDALSLELPKLAEA